jgi:hypothetical protein
MEKLASDKYSSLLRKYINYGHNGLATLAQNKHYKEFDEGGRDVTQ